MELHTFCFTDLSKHGQIFFDYLALRKQHFVDQLDWDLSHDGRFEMDQYDHPLAVYSIVTHMGFVVAGARCLPCSAQWGGWSYMLRDAHLGKLDYIPPDLMAEYPVTARTWECTRLVMQDDLPSADRSQALKLTVLGLCVEGAARGAQTMISLSPAVFGRLLKSIGYDVSIAGKKYKGVEDGRLYCAFSMPCDVAINQNLWSSSLSSSAISEDQSRLLQRLLESAA